MNPVVEAPARRRYRAFRALSLCALFYSSLGAAALAVEQPLGRPGDPISLVVGYQPYFTESWSGLVVRGLKLDEKYLPRGSHVEYQVGISGGGVLLKALQAGRQQIAYLGLMPTVMGAGHRQLADLRIVAVAGQSQDLCNQVLIRADQPTFDSTAAAMAWLNHKRFGIPAGTCADLFSSRLFLTHGIRAANVFDQNVDLLATSFRTGAIDAATIWEPAASALVDAGLARRLLSGATMGESSASFILVRAELLRQRPDVVVAWLRAELEAQAFLADPRNADVIVAMALAQTSNYSAAVLHHALYRDSKSSAGAAPRLTFPFVFTPDIRSMLDRAARYLYRAGKLDAAMLADDAIDPGPAQTAQSPTHPSAHASSAGSRR